MNYKWDEWLSNQEFFDFPLKSFDLRFQLWSFISGDRAGDHLSSNTTRAAQRVFGRDEHIGHVLIFAK